MTRAGISCVLTALLLLASVSARADAVAAHLNVAIPDFGTGVASTSTYAELGIFPRVRTIEAQFLPYALRRRLAASGDWGVVRVVADDAPVEELVIHGDILRSDGRELAIRVRAIDASGLAWLDETFTAATSATAAAGAEPAYESLFAEVAGRLGEALAGQSAEHLENVRDLALMRYGLRLAPKAFDQYVAEMPDGRFELSRLPARSDPMLDRITRIREAEYVIIDAADEKYATLHEDVVSVYDVWRKYSRKSLEYEAQDERRIADSTPPGPRGSYDALLHSYENYKFSRMTAEERDDMAVAFDNEVRPIVERLDERLTAYDAWLEGKYAEWNRLLEELNVLETRFSPQ
ncbi:MAG TPA: hypothetical protein VFY03_01735 [Woeseiaceae bacterium]|nr:hypothetical protein [Woeseiaceae bacterium]